MKKLDLFSTSKLEKVDLTAISGGGINDDGGKTKLCSAMNDGTWATDWINDDIHTYGD